jgi:hypothetical protein
VADGQIRGLGVIRPEQTARLVVGKKLWDQVGYTLSTDPFQARGYCRRDIKDASAFFTLRFQELRNTCGPGKHPVERETVAILV